ncbi:MAG: DUF268 domain-containing protein [Verrucomicrobiota bacterium]
MIRTILRNAGIHPKRIAASFRGWKRYQQDRKSYQMAARNEAFPWARELPILTEWDEASGSLGAYFYQDQRVASWIHEANPIRHVDIGSRLDGFIGSLSVFREVEVIDIRPQPLTAANIRFRQLDLMADLPDEWYGCTDSLSCLHTIEHFGLGRYGDPIDPDGHLKGLEQMKQMVALGGTFYLSTQIGPQRVEFNAHRVFAPETLIGWFREGWEIERCAVIGDDMSVTESPNVNPLRKFTGNLGVGIITARKTG